MVIIIIYRFSIGNLFDDYFTADKSQHHQETIEEHVAEVNGGADPEDE